MNYVIRGLKSKTYYDGEGWGELRKAKVYKGKAATELAFSELALVKQTKKVPFPITRELIKRRSR